MIRTLGAAAVGMMLKDDAISLAKRTAVSCGIPHAVVADANNFFYVAAEPPHGWHWLATPQGHKIVGISNAKGEYQ